ncbi:hypothetical protein Goklo_013732 [Gossypium klotzschianum]|uniref:Major facilitator superfamily (MFS) profile domain-containing protein n=1 Tax=Gossypium klotzschianum TaxID=34286 RepID=A0A7J8U5A8_9ROSI|nr:hypothetical protein [Gossypium klotzschianum]
MDNEQVGLYTLDEALESLGFGKFQAFVLAYAGLGWFAEAMEIMILSFIGQAVKSEWGLSSSQESLLSTIVFAGMVIGAYGWGTISDTYGRRTGFLTISIVTSGAGFLSTFSPNYLSLVILRGFVGFGLGGTSVFLSWFLEFVPASSRGMWMIVFSTFWTFGSIFEATLVWIVMAKLNWRWVLALSSVPSFVLLFMYGVAPESPRYLCMKGRTGDALRILEKIASVNRTKLPAGVLISSRSTDKAEESTPGESGCFPTIQSSGCLLGDSLYVYVAELPGLFLSALLVDRVGRKQTMSIMFGLAFIFLLPLLTRQSAVLTTCLLFGARMNAMATFTVASIYAPELYPTSVRTTGAGVASAVGRIGGMVCPLVSVALVNACHQTEAIAIYLAVIVVSLVCIQLFPYDTKGRELSDTAS